MIIVGVWQCVKTGSADVEKNLSFQPADPSVEKVSDEREPIYVVWSCVLGQLKYFT